MEMDLVLLISIIVSIALFAILFLIEIRAHQKKAHIEYLISAIFCISIGNLFLNIISEFWINQLSYLIYNVGFLILFLHYESIASANPKSKLFFGLVVIFVSGILTSLTIFWIADYSELNHLLRNGSVLDPNYYYMYPIYWFAMLFDNIIGIIVFIRAIQILLQTYKLAHLKATKNEIIALFFLLIGRVFNIFAIIFSGDIMYISAEISLIMSLIGLFFMIGTYLQNPDYLYLLPFPIHSLMVYNRDGILCYSRKVQLKQVMMDEKDILISGALTAISSLIKETLGAQAKIRHINAQQFQIFFKPLPRDSGTFVVIAYGNTALFESSLSRFAENLTPAFFELFNAAGIETTKIQDAIDNLIKDAFPYIQFEASKKIDPT